MQTQNTNLQTLAHPANINPPAPEFTVGSNLVLPPFPEHAWSGIFADYRQLVGHTTEAPLAFSWGALAAALGALVGRSTPMRFGPGHLSPNLLIGLVGATGRGRKSTAADDVVKLVLEPLSPARAPGEPARLEIHSGSGSGEGFTDAIADQTWKPLGSEQLATVTGRRAMYVVHELAELLSKVRRGEAGGMVDFLLGLFDARSPWAHRTKNRVTVITNGVGTMISATTVEGMTKAFSRSDATSGLMNRFLWLAGDRQAPLAFRPPVLDKSKEEFLKKVDAYLKAVNGKELTVSDEARKRHTELYDEDYRSTDGGELYLSATARGDVIALKIAMLLAIANERTEINFDDVDAGWAVVEYSRAVVKQILDRIPERTVQEAEARVLEKAREIALVQSGTFTERDIFQRLKGKRGMSSEVFQRSFAALTNGEIADIVPAPNMPGRWKFAEAAVPSTGWGSPTNGSGGVTP